jgi:hypothetical protein
LTITTISFIGLITYPFKSSKHYSFFFFILGVHIFNDSLVSSRQRGRKAARSRIKQDWVSGEDERDQERVAEEKAEWRERMVDAEEAMISRATSGPGRSSFLMERKVRERCWRDWAMVMTWVKQDWALWVLVLISCKNWSWFLLLFSINGAKLTWSLMSSTKEFLAKFIISIYL